MRILVTGGAGFIGYHLSDRLLRDKHDVVGFDNLNDYYDVSLKHARLDRLRHYPSYSFVQGDVRKLDEMMNLTNTASFDIIIHLAAMAGVRYAIDHGDEYVDTNIDGTYNIFEFARRKSIRRVIYASSSSVYGTNAKLPSGENDNTDRPASLYAATKKASELLAYNFHYIHGVNSIGLRFFTVYGPWGRPDMALFLFTKGILSGTPIDVYNEGKMKRDFTYIDDIVEGIICSMNVVDGFDVFNLGSGYQVELMDFIKYVEKAAGKKASINFKPMQPGDVKESFADITAARKQLAYEPRTTAEQGVKRFVEWYRDYYHL